MSEVISVKLASSPEDIRGLNHLRAELQGNSELPNYLRKSGYC